MGSHKKQHWIPDTYLNAWDRRKIGGRNHFRALNGVVSDVCRDCLVSDSGQHQLLRHCPGSLNKLGL